MGAEESKSADNPSSYPTADFRKLVPGNNGKQSPVSKLQLYSNSQDGSFREGMDTIPLYVDAGSVLYSNSFYPETPADAYQFIDDDFAADPEVSFRETSGKPLAIEEFEWGVPAVKFCNSNSLTSSMISSGVLVTPQYNAEGSEVGEDLLSHSPVLRSYHDKAFPNSFSSTYASHLAPAGSPVSIHGVEVTRSSGSGANTVGRHDRFFEIAGNPLGLENFGSTCYANSVIQLIYHCAPLRLRLLELYEAYKVRHGYSGFEEKTILHTFCQLIHNMHKSNNMVIRKGEEAAKFVSPKVFLAKVANSNPFFTNAQQDAHEFCMYLLNEIFEGEKKIMKNPKNVRYFRETRSKNKFSFFSSTQKSSTTAKTAAAEGGDLPPVLPPLQAIMQGSFLSVTACLNCHSISHHHELFLDLSLNTHQGASLLNCLSHLNEPSLFYGTNKYHCDRCKKPVNAANSMQIVELPQFALLIHLKRFRYDAERGVFAKTAHHVALPMEMDLQEYKVEVPSENFPESDETKSAPATEENISTEAEPSIITIPPSIRKKIAGVAHCKARFELTGFVAHVGEGPNSGHYFTCTRYGPNCWRRFDDDVVTTMTRREVQQLFGVPLDGTGMITTTAYILLYERVA